ncbi:hypothetical protein PENTCL1PPCAC_25237, partial [Pristionchus entomophagus]
PLSLYESVSIHHFFSEEQQPNYVQQQPILDPDYQFQPLLQQPDELLGYGMQHDQGVQHSHVHSQNVTKKSKHKPKSHENSLCANCGTSQTTLWRRNDKGQTECNSCNLFERK